MLWHYEDMNNEANKTLTITIAAHGYRIDDGDETTKFIKAGNPSLAADIVSEFFGESLLYGTVRDYLDAGCELVDIERDPSDGCIIINALKNGCDVGEFNASPCANTDDVDLVDLFDSLPNLDN